jgi:hypothetical protein
MYIIFVYACVWNENSAQVALMLLSGQCLKSKKITGPKLSQSKSTKVNTKHEIYKTTDNMLLLPVMS